MGVAYKVLWAGAIDRGIDLPANLPFLNDNTTTNNLALDVATWFMFHNIVSHADK